VANVYIFTRIANRILRCATGGIYASHCNLTTRWFFCKRVFVSGGSDDFSRKRFLTPNQHHRKIVGVALATRGLQPNQPPPVARPRATIARAPFVTTRTGATSSLSREPITYVRQAPPIDPRDTKEPPATGPRGVPKYGG
jgi:hypothetical protein